MAKKAEKKKEKLIHTIGKRKSATARAVARKGTGKIMINSRPAELMEPEMARMMVKEPLLLAGEKVGQLDVDVQVSGGGIMGQAEAARQAIAKALVAADKHLKPVFLNYDRSLVVADPRRNEPHKPSRSKAGPRRHKQRSKR